MLTVEKLSVRRGGALAVDGISLRVREGEWWMLAGPNGAGKSTLIEAVARGLPYAGRVLVRGRDARGMRASEFARDVGVLAQSNAAAYDFTVEEVVRMGRYAHARGPFSRGDAEGGERVDEAIRRTGLESLRHQSVRALSGGEAQRAFLAQVFAQNPAVLILDEPANHLDIAYQQQLFSWIGDWLRAPGRAVISAVHDLSLARLYGTHALLLDRGRAVASGEVADVLARENLRSAYGVDVFAWMRTLLGQWGEGSRETNTLRGQ